MSTKRYKRRHRDSIVFGGGWIPLAGALKMVLLSATVYADRDVRKMARKLKVLASHATSAFSEALQVPGERKAASYSQALMQAAIFSTASALAIVMAPLLVVLLFARERYDELSSGQLLTAMFATTFLLVVARLSRAEAHRSLVRRQ